MKRIFCLIIFILAFSALTVLGSSTSGVLSNESWNYAMHNYYGDSFNPPTSAINKTEHISGVSGSLSLKSNQLHLPGKNGLDLNLGISYSSSAMYDSFYYLQDTSSKSFRKLLYVYKDASLNTNYYIMFNNEDEMYNSANDGIYVKSNFKDYEKTKTSSGEIINYYIAYQIRAEDTDASKIYLERDKSIRFKYLHYEGFHYVDTLTTGSDYNIGSNWKFNLPELCINRRKNYRSGYELYGAFIDMDGSSYKLCLSYYIDGSKTDTDGGYVSHDSYQLDNISVNPRLQENGLTYNVTIRDDKGRIMYFGSNGAVVAIEDLYGNRITFEYDGLYLSKIVDTYGREIIINKTSHNDAGDSYVISYEDPDTENSKTISYTFTVEENPNGESNLAVDDTYVLTVTDANGNNTIYKHKYCWQAAEDSYCCCIRGGEKVYELPNITSRSVENYILQEIIYPTGAETHYNTERKIYKLNNRYKEHNSYCGWNSKERYVSRCDLVNGEEFNKHTYTYNNPSDGYQYNTDYSMTDLRNADNYKVITTFDINSNPKSYEYKDNNCTKKIVYEEYRSKDTLTSSQCNLLSRVVYIYENSTMANSKTSYSYRFGKISMEEKDDIKTYYDYGSSLNNNLHLYPLTIKYTRSDNKEILITNTLTEDKKNIAETTVAENNVLKAKTAYTYDEYGNVIKTRVWEEDTNGDGVLDGADKFTDVNAVYTYNADKTYSIYKYVENLQNADGSMILAENPLDSENNKVGYAYDFDSIGNVVSNTSPGGNTITLNYDKLNRPVSKTFSDNTQQTIFFDDVENYIISTDENGIETKYNYDPLGKLVKKSVKNAGKWVTLEEYRYDGAGRLAETKTYRNETDYISTLCEYDGQDRLIKQTVRNEHGQTETEYTVSYAVAALNRKNHLKVTTSYMPDGEAAPASNSKYYDNLNRLVREENSSGETTYVTTYAYDNVGNVISVTNPRANAADGKTSETYEYDYAGNLVKTTNALGDSAVSVYDMSGKKISDTDYMGNTTEYTYDKLGRIIKTVSPFESGKTSETQSIYNADGYIVKSRVKKAENEYDETIYEYDSRGRTTREAAENREINYTYDPAGRLVSRILSANSQPKTTTYEYDFLNHKTKETSPLGYFETYEYDYSGNLISQTDEMNNTLEMSYNARNLVTSKKTDGKVLCSYEYSPLGSLKRSQNSDTTIVYTYDPFNRLISETDTSAANTYTKNYTYDEENNRKTFVLTINGTQKQSVSYDYDTLNRLISVSDGGENISYSYDKNGQLLNKNVGTHTAESYSYNAGGLPVLKISMTNNNVINSAQIDYFLNGNPKRISQPGKPDVSYDYDGGNMLKKETVEGVSTDDYIYDTAGNIMFKRNRYADSTGVFVFGWDDNNRMTKTIYEGENGTYTYDDAGRLTNAVRSGIAEAYSYDIFGRITSGTKNNVAFSYTYDANGLRTSKTVDGATTYYVYDGENIIAEISAGRETIYLRDNTGIVSRTRGNAKEYFVSNYRGDTTAVVNANADILKSYEYDAFGNMKNAASADDNPFRYCGEYFDDETGFVYLRNRYYDPSIGRFTTEDPAKSGLNWYAYCENNPVKYVDPWGLIREPGYVDGNWYKNPDKHEFGESSDTYKILVDLGDRWNSGSVQQKAEYASLAENVRRFAREKTPIQYAQNKIINQLHENAKIATDYQSTMTKGFSGFIYQLGGGDYWEDSTTFLIGMAYGDWNYKYDSNWQVPYDYFDGNDMNINNNKNWRPWMYFDGMLVSADKFGNINMAYVGTKMDLPHSVFQNFATNDKDDAFWVQYGIDMAEGGR